MFGNNTQSQSQPAGGSLFSGTNNNLLGANNSNSNSNNKGLFGDLLSNNNNQNTNNQQTNENKNQTLFSNTSNGNNTLFGANNNQGNSNTNDTNNKGLFSAFSSNNSNNLFGNFQNNKSGNDNNKSIFPSGTALFGTQTNNTQSVQNSQANKEQKDKKDEGFSLFGNNFGNTQEKPKENNLTINTNDQNKPNLFSNTSKEQPAFLFGAPKEEKKSEIKTNELNTQVKTQTQTQSQIQIQKDNNENNKPTNSLFGNNINNQSGAKTGNLFGNNDIKKDEQKQNKNTISIPNQNPNQPSSIFNNNVNNNNANANQNAQNQNNVNNNNQQANIKSNENKNYLNLKIPEKPFEFSFGNSKELEDYEKNQLMHKTNKEIIEDFKNMLLTQKAKYKQCVANTRQFERKIMGIIEITNSNSLMSEKNEKNGQKYLSKINSLYYQSKNLENILTNFNEKLGQTLSPYRDNVMNSDKILLNQNNSERFKFYENFSQISEKCYLIENSINEAEQNLAKKEKEIKEKEGDKGEGIWIERNKGKIFVNQNEINNLFSECYDGLSNLKSLQDNIDKKYEMLKMKLLQKTGNNYINNFNINNNNFKYDNIY